LTGGEHQFRCFDDEQEAHYFADLMREGVYQGVGVRQVYLWEM